jgi:glycosyltransferase involved in cell wall biosynthesis
VLLPRNGRQPRLGQTPTRMYPSPYSRHADCQSTGSKRVRTQAFLFLLRHHEIIGVKTRRSTSGKIRQSFCGYGNASRSTKMTFQFITAIPLNVWKGSGCFVGIKTLATGIRALGGEVNFVTPRLHLPIYAAERMLFNHMLRYREFSSHDTIVGFDADGHSIAGRHSSRHVADIKGVIADVLPYESGAARASMAFQANLEKRHARRADLVVTPSHYCAVRLDELYGVRDAVVIPELIDLDRWRDLLWRNPAPASPRQRFIVLCVCRFYSRKRVHILLRAAAFLRARMPELEVRIVGAGPEGTRLRRLWRELRLEENVRWLGDVTAAQLAAEYNGADVFCLPSVQEGFGIVFLEAMAAGKPIVAARASAVPEVVRHGLLVEPESVDALADAIEKLYGDAQLRASLAEQGRRDVEHFDMRRISRLFVETVSGGVREKEIAR